jgi:hypothetical protein
VALPEREEVRLVRISWFASVAISVAACCLLAATALGGAAAAQAASSSSPDSPVAVNWFSRTGNINDVAAISAGNAWAVGWSGTVNSANTGQYTLILHWNGKKWAPETSLKPLPGWLGGVAIASANSVWAVGSVYTPHTKVQKVLILHWNGKVWRRQTAVPAALGFLNGVAVSGNTVWAVGENGNQNTPLMLHLIGGHWYVVPTGLSSLSDLDNVAATGPDAAWAAGAFPAVLMRWSGAEWRSVSFPLQGGGNDLYAIAAGPSGAAWGVGDVFNSSTDNSEAASMRWNGRAWLRVPVSAPVGATLYGVGLVPGGGLWAVGAVQPALAGSTLIMRWTGKAWARVKSPNATRDDWLAEVAATSADNAWAVGESQASTSSDAVSHTLILHWNGKSWS